MPLTGNLLALFDGFLAGKIELIRVVFLFPPPQFLFDHSHSLFERIAYAVGGRQHSVDLPVNIFGVWIYLPAKLF